MDLQLHFFWSFSLTIRAFFWAPFIVSGVIITVGKEILDVMAPKGWSWGDFFFGMFGAGTGLLFLRFAGYLPWALSSGG